VREVCGVSARERRDVRPQLCSKRHAKIKTIFNKIKYNNLEGKSPLLFFFLNWKSIFLAPRRALKGIELRISGGFA